jgi:dTDP-4-dehydrorhamnose 3,5-epimerase
VETYNEETFAEAMGLGERFVQDNESQSVIGTVRGIHYQLPPRAQGKLVRVLEGAAFDIAVDLRRSSPTLGQWTGILLSQENHAQLWIPAGFGHGFLALTDPVRVAYKTTDFYDQTTDRCIRWDDPEIGIDWPIGALSVIVSEKDATAPGIADAELYD